MLMLQSQVLFIVVLASIVTCAVSGSEQSNAYISISSRNGTDNLSCLNGSIPCHTLQYALRNASSLGNVEVVLKEDYYLKSSLTVSNVIGLTLRGEGDNNTIACSTPSSADEEGSGLTFINVTDLTVINLTIKECGALQLSTTQKEETNSTHKYRSALYIINCTDVIITTCHFLSNIGKAITLYDTNGTVLISNSCFSGNAVPQSEEESLWGGGAVYIEFTYCIPGLVECDPAENKRNKNNKYKIFNCSFIMNRVTNRITSATQQHTVQFSILAGNYGINLGQGGGISTVFKGSSANNDFAIANCSFTNNTAVYGGGIDVLFQDFASFTVNECNFVNNSAPIRSAGAMQIGFLVTHNVSNNTVFVSDSNFTRNSAGWGGAIEFFSTRSPNNIGNKLHFSSCSWIENSASIGAAIFLRPDSRSTLFDGFHPEPSFRKCIFINNTLTDEALFLISEVDQQSRHVVGSGSLHLDTIVIDVYDLIVFSGNRGGAVFANSAKINIKENTTALFTSNSATYGGALALHGFSVLQTFENTDIIFESNSATELGGAIYATESDQVDYIISHSCFIDYNTSDPLLQPSEWKTSFQFINNTAQYGKDIYTDSLLSCAKMVGKTTTNVSEGLHWNIFSYSSYTNSSIATSPAAIDFTIPKVLSPGERVNLAPKARDDLNHTIITVYRAFLTGSIQSVYIDKASFYISDGYIQINGEPNSDFTLTLQTVDARHISSSREGMLSSCPLGFILQDMKCVCSANNSDTQFVGIPKCSTTSFQPLLLTDYWAGCIGNDTFVTSQCPTGYCSYPHAEVGLTALLRSCSQIQKEGVCIRNRKGLLCGECKDGYSVFYHSQNFKCGKCSYGAVGILLYVVAELVPLTLLFAAIILFQINLTSGLLSSCILFAQIIDLMNYKVSKRQSSGFNALENTFPFFLGFLNLDFFKLDSLSFCLWNNATVLDNITFRYITTAYSILLLAAIIIAFQCFSIRKLLLRNVCCKRIRNWLIKQLLDSNPIIHSISTFLILSFAQYTITSFQILAVATLYGEGGVREKSVVMVSGNIEFFSGRHLSYAIPALLVVLLLSVPPPLLLISYPLLWKIKAKCSCIKDDKTCWPIRKLLPLIDSFQGGYKDSLRFFSGLLFLWRIIITAIFAFTSDPTQFFLVTEIALLCMLVTHATTAPFKKWFYNTVDMMIFANLSIINALSWFASSISHDTTSWSIEVTEAIGSIKLLLTSLPPIYIIVIVILKCLLKFEAFRKQLEKLAIPHKLFSEYSSKAETSMSTKNVQVNNAFPDEELFVRAEMMNDFNSSPSHALSTFSDIEFIAMGNALTQSTDVSPLPDGNITYKEEDRF